MPSAVMTIIEVTIISTTTSNTSKINIKIYNREPTLNTIKDIIQARTN
jgi:hypothetical protein